jgi:hypothetical protein
MGGGVDPMSDAEWQEPCPNVEVCRPGKPEFFEQHELGRRNLGKWLREGSAGGLH